MKKKGLEPKQFKITNMEDNKLPKSLESRNDFNEAKKLINDIRIDKNNVEVRYKDKKVFNDLNRWLNDISNNKDKKEDVIKRLKKCISDLNQLRQKQSNVFQNKMIQVVYQFFNSLVLNKKSATIIQRKRTRSIKAARYIKVSSNRFYELKNNIDNKKSLMTRVKDWSGKTITIDIKDASNLMDHISKNQITYDEVKMIFNYKIISAGNKIAITNLTDKTKLLKIFFDLREVLSGELYGVKIVDGKYESVKLKNKADDEQSRLEIQREMPSELGNKEELKFEKRRQKFDEQPDTTDMPDLESEESADQKWQRLKILTPNQMLSRLPISLSQLKAENNSKKLKNEIRQPLYSSYRSKKSTKQFYKSLTLFQDGINF